MSYLIFTDQKALMGHFRQKIGAKATIELYSDLVHEEFTEFVVAMADLRMREDWMNLHPDAICLSGFAPEVTEVADGLIDIIVVAAGMLHALGLEPQALWDEVNRSNIAKIKHPCSHCVTTGYVSGANPSEPTACPTCGGQGFVYEARKDENGKWVKPDGWTKPALLPLVAMMLPDGDD